MVANLKSTNSYQETIKIQQQLLNIFIAACMLVNSFVLLISLFGFENSPGPSIFTLSFILAAFALYLNNSGHRNQNLAKHYFLILCNLALIGFVLAFGQEAMFQIYFLAISQLGIVLFKGSSISAHFYVALSFGSWLFSAVITQNIAPQVEVSNEYISRFNYLNLVLVFALLVMIMGFTKRLTLGYIREIKDKNRELSEQLDREKQLVSQNKNLDEFSAIVTHDLKAPLSNLEYLFQRLKNKMPPEFKTGEEELLKHISGCMGKMKNLIFTVLNYSKGEHENVSFSKYKLADALFDVDLLLKGKGNLNIDLSTAPSHIYGNKFQLEQVLLNLVDNALKHSSSNKRKVFISATELQTDSVLFRISDHGKPMDPLIAKDIFNFFRGFSKNKKHHFGIGLSIVRKLVIQNGGKFGMESNSSVGNTFWFTWPTEQKTNVDQLIHLN
ncbi:sensor histidine kinase [Luteibaculum oceani]|uniref:histidine kinase n=1 Tax=Luteibaculum oceani TaxID=1294296 RepID=A0A5C6V7U5_9FLAO|nr:HAMP domain-containing sensor histidine kinase [Luteibaculum oceani]TXC81332.1 HAMP domain-containing histidine kinase [Luteibaculum oceani]